MITRIKNQLKNNPKGMIISDLSHILNINRNIMAKYLEILLVAGEVEMEMHGNAKVYSLSRRIPLPHILNTSSDKIILLDKQGRIIWLNDSICSSLKTNPHDLVGRTLAMAEDPFLTQIPYHATAGQDNLFSEISVQEEGKLAYYRVKQTPTVMNDGEDGIIIQCDDITKEKSFERMMELSEARFQAIVEDQTEFILRFLPDGTLTFVNKTYASLVGKQVRELVGTPFNLNIVEEKGNTFHSILSQFSPERSVKSLNCRFITENGFQHQSWTIRALFDDTGNITEYQCIGRDITDQMEAKEQLISHASSLRFLSEKTKELLKISGENDLYGSIAEALYDLCPRGYISISSFDNPTLTATIRHVCGREVRQVFREITGVEVVGLSFIINDPTALEVIRSNRIMKAYGDLYTGFFGQIPYPLCKLIEEQLGIDEIYVIPLTNRDEILGIIAILPQYGEKIENPMLIETFISQASLVLSFRRKEVISQRIQERSLATLEDMTEFVTGFRTDGSLHYVNPAYANYLGKKPDQLQGCMHIPYIVNKVIPYFTQMNISQEHKDICTSVQCKMVHPSGIIRWHQWKIRPLFDEKGEIIEYHGIGSDITPIQEAKENASRYQNDLEFLARKNTEFAQISHDTDIFPIILSGIHEIIPESIIAIYSYDDYTNSISMRGISPQTMIPFFTTVTCEDIIGKRIPAYDQDILNLMRTGKIIKIPGNSYFTMFGTTSMLSSQKNEFDFFSGTDNYCIGLVFRNSLLGYINVALKYGDEIPRPNLIEIYTHQASIALSEKFKTESLSKSNSIIDRISETHPDLIIKIQSDGTLTYVNRSFCKIMKSDEQVLLGRSFFSKIPDHEKDMVINALENEPDDRDHIRIEHQMISEDGQIFDINWKYSLIPDKNGKNTHYLCIGIVDSADDR